MIWKYVLARALEGDPTARALMAAIAALSVWPKYRLMGSPQKIFESLVIQ